MIVMIQVINNSNTNISNNNSNKNNSNNVINKIGGETKARIK